MSSGGKISDTSSIFDRRKTAALTNTLYLRKSTSIFKMLAGWKTVDILKDIIWPAISGNVFCHDSVSCRHWPNSHPFPSSRRGVSEYYVGREYDAHDEPIDPADMEDNGADQACTDALGELRINKTLEALR